MTNRELTHDRTGHSAKGGMSRRNFLKLSAVLGAALAAPPIFGNGGTLPSSSSWLPVCWYRPMSAGS